MGRIKVLNKASLFIAVVTIVAHTQIALAQLKMIDLGTLVGMGGFYSSADAINNAGQIAGQSTNSPGKGNAFLWTEETGMIDIGTLNGIPVDVNAINDIGQIVGTSLPQCCTNHAFLWQNGGMTDLGTLGGDWSWGHSLNNLGQVVGYSSIFPANDHVWHAFIWQEGAGMTDLGTLGGDGSSAFDINDSGQVVGYSYTPSSGHHAFIWSQNEGMRDLGTLGGDISLALAINETGQVTGWSSTTDGYTHAFIWQNGVMTDLGTLGENYIYSSPYAINNSGQVIGNSKTASGEQHAFIWLEDKGMTDLGTLGGNFSEAVSINDAGQVIGNSITSSGKKHAFIWQNEVMIDLGTLGGDLSEVHAINTAGQVVGMSRTSTGAYHAFLSYSTFNIHTIVNDGGNISPYDPIVTYGSTPTFFITPWKYYCINDVKVDGSSVGAVTEYTFNNVTDNHTIEAIFSPVNIAVTSPNGRETWDIGTTQTISWTYIDTPGKVVSIELLKGGDLYKIINPGVAIGKGGGNSYTWHIQSKLPPGSDYQIRITSTNNMAFSDTSDGTFTIR